MYFGLLFSALNNIIFLDIPEILSYRGMNLFISRWQKSVTRYQSNSFPLAVNFKFCGSLDFAPGIRWYSTVYESHTHYLFGYDILLRVKVFISDRLPYVCVFYVNNKI
jgi:hypothetical protein